MYKKLKAITYLCSIVSSISTTNWAYITSSLFALLYMIWAWITKWGYFPIALSGIITFGVALWIFNGFIWLRNQKKPIREKLSFDYSYGLALTGLHLGFDERSNDHAFQLGLILFNATSLPIKYLVEDIIIIVGDRTIASPQFVNRTALISSRTNNTFFYPSFRKEAITSNTNNVEAIIKYSIKYGHPEFGFVRKSQKNIKVNLRLDDKPAAIYLVENESDDPLIE